MNDARTDNPNDATQPSIESARETAVRGLAQRATSGSLTLDEYAERALAVRQAASAEELDVALLGLPEEAAGAPAARRPRWLVNVLVGGQWRGPWRLSDHLRVVAVFAVATLDLGTAQPEAPESVITVVTAFGGASIIAPQGVSIQLSGFSLFGGRSDKRAELPPLPGSPLVRVRAFSLFGGVRVEDRPPRRNLLDVIRARSKPTGS
jgi:hypothetical protein